MRPARCRSRWLAVEATEETGRRWRRPGQFSPAGKWPGGVFGFGLRTEVAITDARGRATLHSVQFNRVSGRFHMQIVASKEQARAGILSFQ